MSVGDVILPREWKIAEMIGFRLGAIGVCKGYSLLCEHFLVNSRQMLHFVL